MTNLMFAQNLKKYKCHKIFIIMIDMQVKLRQNVIAKINDKKAEIIVEDKYRLFIILQEKKVIAKYSNTILTVEFDKFDIEKLAKKIHTIVEQSHKFSVILIQEVLELMTIENLYNEIIDKIEKFKEAKDIEKLQKIYEFLNQMK